MVEDVGVIFSRVYLSLAISDYSSTPNSGRKGRLTY